MTQARTKARPARDRLVDTAVQLTREQGFHRTTLADIAKASGVPLGNVYYYFKTKDAIGEALVDTLASTQASLRQAWDSKSDPRARLAAFVQTIVDNRDSLAQSGCPIGTLCAELHKLHDAERSPLARHAATLFGDLLDWLEAQFRLLGKQGESRDLAVHLLSALEGASLLAHTFDDAQLVAREGARLERWVRTL